MEPGPERRIRSSSPLVQMTKATVYSALSNLSSRGLLTDSNLNLKLALPLPVSSGEGQAHQKSTTFLSSDLPLRFPEAVSRRKAFATSGPACHPSKIPYRSRRRSPG